MSALEATGVVKRKNILHTGGIDGQVLVAAVAGRQLRVLALTISNNHATTDTQVTIQDSDTNPLIGPIYLPAKGTVILPSNGEGWGESPSGKGLQLHSTGALTVAGSLTYQETGY